MSLLLTPGQKTWQGVVEKDDSIVQSSTVFRYKEVNRWDVFMRQLWPRSGFIGCSDSTSDPNCPNNLAYTSEDMFEYPDYDNYKVGNNTLTLYKIQGVTKDSGGSPLGNCQVSLFLTATDVEIDSIVSDAAGNYLLYTPYQGLPHYCVSFKDPNLTGATVRTLMGA